MSSSSSSSVAKWACALGAVAVWCWFVGALTLALTETHAVHVRLHGSDNPLCTHAGQFGCLRVQNVHNDSDVLQVKTYVQYASSACTFDVMSDACRRTLLDHHAWNRTDTFRVYRYSHDRAYDEQWMHHVGHPVFWLGLAFVCASAAACVGACSCVLCPQSKCRNQNDDDDDCCTCTRV